MSCLNRVFNLSLALENLYNLPEARQMRRALCREEGVRPVSPVLDRSSGHASTLPVGCASVRVKPNLGLMTCAQCGAECIKDNAAKRYCSKECCRVHHRELLRSKYALEKLSRSAVQ